MPILLYGANGYTAQLMLPLMKEYSLVPILAGRSAEKLAPLAAQYGFDYQAFDLSETAKLDAALEKVALVLHCAGPFSHTARPMMEACLRTGRHYLDITGEIEVFELAARMGQLAEEKGIILLPGVGFDVVPTDCTAAALKEKMPDATHLTLAFASIGGGTSHGTAKTSLESMGKPGAVRRAGKITPVPLAYKSMEVDFGSVRRFCMCIPWGDVSTAWHSTGIPNIEVYTSVHPKTFKRLRWQRYFMWFFRISSVQNYARKKIEQSPAGPDAARRARAKMLVWGEARNAAGQSIEARLELTEGYTFTAHAALHIARKVLEIKDKAGFFTPSKLLGSGLVGDIQGARTINA